MSDSDAEKLLRIAQGVDAMEEPTDEQKIEEAKLYWNTLPADRKEKVLHRRRLRENMFKILKYEARDLQHLMTPELEALKEIIDEQLNSNMGLWWKGFTFVWDIHPTGVPVIVRKEAWIREGGQFDPDIGVHMPAAFTEQEID